MKTVHFAVVCTSFLLALAIISCDDDSGTNGQPDPIQFPMGIGMYWVYEVYDSLTQTTDTVKISTVDSLQLSGGSFAYVQHSLSYAGEFERIQQSPHDDTLDVYTGPEEQPSPSERFVFSLTPGSTWTGPYDQSHDTSVVADSEAVVTPAGVFYRCARVDRRWDGDTYGGFHSVTTWIYGSAGIVKRRFLTVEPELDFAGITQNEVWTLIRYDLVMFPRSSFPDNAGVWWRYATYDSLTETVDTITITVRGKLPPLSRDIPITVWEIRSDNADSAIVDSLYLADDGPVMRLSEDTLFTVAPHEVFPFPLAVGRTWGLIFIVPAPDIVEKMPIEVPAGHLRTAFQSYTPGRALNDFWVIDTWLVPHVGIVKRHDRRTGLGPVVNTTWELLDYSAVAAR